MSIRDIAVLILVGSLLGGCASTPRNDTRISQEPYSWPEYPLATTPGAIYQAGRGSSLFEDVRARRVGDVITVVLQESTNAAQSASTSTSKDSSVNLANPTLFGNPFSFGSSLLGDSRRNLQTDIGGSRSFSGEGGSQQSNRLTGNITATVVEVLPNGYLRIRGEKLISINKGDEYIRLTGVVRPVDIQADNSVLSTMVANAEIAYGGNGVLADASEMGWLSRFFNSKWWPF